MEIVHICPHCGEPVDEIGEKQIVEEKAALEKAEKAYDLHLKDFSSRWSRRYLLFALTLATVAFLVFISPVFLIPKSMILPSWIGTWSGITYVIIVFLSVGLGMFILARKQEEERTPLDEDFRVRHPEMTKFLFEGADVTAQSA